MHDKPPKKEAEVYAIDESIIKKLIIQDSDKEILFQDSDFIDNFETFVSVISFNAGAILKSLEKRKSLLDPEAKDVVSVITMSLIKELEEIANTINKESKHLFFSGNNKEIFIDTCKVVASHAIDNYNNAILNMASIVRSCAPGPCYESLKEMLDQMLESDIDEIISISKQNTELLQNLKKIKDTIDSPTFNLLLRYTEHQLANIIKEVLAESKDNSDSDALTYDFVFKLKASLGKLSGISAVIATLYKIATTSFNDAGINKANTKIENSDNKKAKSSDQRNAEIVRIANNEYGKIVERQKENVLHYINLFIENLDSIRENIANMANTDTRSESLSVIATQVSDYINYIRKYLYDNIKNDEAKIDYARLPKSLKEIFGKFINSVEKRLESSIEVYNLEYIRNHSSYKEAKKALENAKNMLNINIQS